MLHVRALLLLLLFDAARAAVKLNDYILHYETLSYDNSAIHGSHLRAKRSLGKDPFVHINFHAHGRQFHVRIRHDRSVFADNLVVDTPAGKLDDFDVSHLYSGSLWGEADTYAFGSIQDGIFDGKIITPKGNYYLERADKYFSPPPASLDFHSVIYSEDDVVDAHADKRAGNGIGCGINHDVRLWMETIQNSAVEEAPSNENATQQNDTVDAVQEQVIPQFYKGLLHHKYTKEAQVVVPADETTITKDDVPPLESHRSKRAVYGINKRACSLYIQTDPLLWDYIHKKENDDTKTREEIASLISQHVKAVNIIYENEDFGGFRGIKFLVQRITINDSSACEGDHRRQQNPFCSNNIDVSNFLNLNSQINHDAFCLAYVFTYRDFTGGTLGLAWVASPQGASGGICEKFKTYTENLGGRHVQTKRSLNTGIITFVNYNSRVPPKVSQLTLAHEIGHNFGSPHDYPLECRPGGQEGNYIMFASATPGDRPNNSKFSTCSRRNITSVLEAVFSIKTGKDNCFIEEDGPFCGNHIVEAGEDCDCGYDDEECTEMCCHPRESKDPEAKPCKHRRGNCSPSEGPCCNHNCEYDENKICRQESDCNLISYCDGYHAQCPPSKPKANGTLCNKETQVCLKGDCVGSICLKYELEECFLSKSPGVTPEQLCEVACQQRGRPTTCQSTFHLQDSAGRNMTGIRLRPGSPCDNFQGFCDVFQKCRAVDAEGPLARLKNLLFNEETLMTISQWVTRYWWGVLMISVAFVVVMGIFIKCCAVHTPSSNPKKAPALRITDTLRRPAATLRRKRRHQTAPQSAMMQGPPPPYPGYPSRNSGGGGGPPSRGVGGGAVASGRPRGPGYGEGRGHYNRKKEFMGHGMPYAAAYNPQQQQQQQQQRQHRPQSHIEMNHLNV